MPGAKTISCDVFPHQAGSRFSFSELSNGIIIWGEGVQKRKDNEWVKKIGNHLDMFTN